MVVVSQAPKCFAAGKDCIILSTRGKKTSNCPQGERQASHTFPQFGNLQPAGLHTACRFLSELQRCFLVFCFLLTIACPACCVDAEVQAQCTKRTHSHQVLQSHWINNHKKAKKGPVLFILWQLVPQRPLAFLWSLLILILIPVNVPLGSYMSMNKLFLSGLIVWQTLWCHLDGTNKKWQFFNWLQISEQ